MSMEAREVHVGGVGLSQLPKKMKRPREEVGSHQLTAFQPAPSRRQHQNARQQLPIWRQKIKVVETVRRHASVVLVGETGSGKSTQVPQFLLDAGFCAGIVEAQGSTPSPIRARKLIACTQPRRVAAITVAGRVAEEMGCALGQAVGYAVRFDDKTGPRTVIKYMTDGVLLREAMTDPLLTRYAVIILDEAHERSLQTDILFGLIRRAQREREDLRVVVMSATLDVEVFRRFFETGGRKEEKALIKRHGENGKHEKGMLSREGQASMVGVVRIEGRQYGVEVYYCEEAQEDSIDAACLAVLQIHESEPLPGDILVFLSGQEDIEALAELLSESAETDTSIGKTGLCMEICSLYSALAPEEQAKAFRPPKGPAKSTRKVILATNIAETSVTINGIRHVVDTGWVKVRRYVPSTGLDSLKVTQIARAQAQQRTGRAGREASGKCYRLFTESAFERLDAVPQPEIQRVNLTQVVLQLLAMGVDDPQHFDYLSPPSATALARAFETLLALGCIAEGGLSPGGNVDGTRIAIPEKDDRQAVEAQADQKPSGPAKSRPVITPHGRRVASLPLDPVYAHFVLRASELGCLSEALTAVSMLSAENVLYMPSPHGGPDAAEQRNRATTAHRALAAYDGDVPTLVHIYERWVAAKKGSRWCWDHFVNARAMKKADEVREQLLLLARRLGLDPSQSCGNERQIFLRSLAAGLFLNVARRQPATSPALGKYCYKMLATGREAAIHPSSVLHARNPAPQCVVFTEVLTTSRPYIRGVSIVDPADLQELVPQFFGRA